MAEEKSLYLVKLEVEHPDVAERYKQKISAIGLDPFLIKEDNTSFNPTDFPSVSNMDIVSYLVLSTSYYTKDQMKAYKSLAAYRSFQSGFVSKCGVTKVKDFYVLLGRVKHSQHFNEPPLHVWVICNETGSIESAHCTCMAGAGEVCSHVGALLYAVEFINTTCATTSCTDVRSLWNVPTLQQVRCEPLRNMTFGRIVPAASPSEDIPAVKEVEIVKMLQKLKDAGTSSAMMHVVEPFASELQTCAVLLVNPYKELYNNEYEELYLEQLLQLAEQYVEISISEETCQQIEEATRGQATSQEWFHQRTGRITASLLKRVCSTSVVKPSLSLIKQICYPLKFKFRSKETEWGLRQEPLALDAYSIYARPYHQDLKLEKTGLVVRSDLPQFGASPDALVSCTCCGRACVEVKCPFFLKTGTMSEYAQKKGSCLLLSDSGNIYVNQNHAYYFQVQQQMALTQTAYCDFIVWSPDEMFIERIKFSEDFWAKQQGLALTFHHKVIMPELLGRFFTKNTPSVQTWCLCEEPDDGRVMICCNNELCEIKWFHLQCLNIADVPNDIWFCEKCVELFTVELDYSR